MSSGQVEPGRARERGVARLEPARADEAGPPGSTPRKTFSATVSCGTSEGSCAIAATPCSSASRGGAERRPRGLQEQRDRASGDQRAGDDPAERRLAGAVLADERVHRASADGERNARERLDAAEVLGDVQELEVDCGPPRPCQGAALAGPLRLELRRVRLRDHALVRQAGEHVDARRSPCRS